MSEEEQASVEVFSKTEDQAIARLERVLATFRDHRKRSNEEVVRATQAQLANLDTALSNRGEQIKAADEQLADKHAELARLNVEINKKRVKAGLSTLPLAPNGSQRTGV